MHDQVSKRQLCLYSLVLCLFVYLSMSLLPRPITQHSVDDHITMQPSSFVILKVVLDSYEVTYITGKINKCVI